MDIFQKKCPCCNAKINKLLFWFSKKVNNGCKYKTDFICYYCPKCKKQISKGYHARFELILGGVFFVFSWILSKVTIDFFEFLPNFPNIAKTIPLILLILLYSILFMYLYISFVSLKCCEQEDNQNLKEADGDNKLFNGFIELEEHVRTTPFEKKMKYHMIFSPLYYFIIVLFVFILYLLIQ